ncbi:phosphopantetheine-binding protein [Streptomyces yunnanensis]|uniref:Phosphopantetheine-binding protein n=1 Tax=Streptomyces yunnanensis TaxID=156453 RepID=A0ABY8AEK7_9ACTN|nr:phosphopantetheine-binding protein [Streptomyces yunnanensis]WEB42131.1 phosphopantetheine-binding protein [Streptomyces yunnanensis]
MARHVVRTLGERGISTSTAEELIEDADLRILDLSLLGLSSLDWIALATRLEDETGGELPDHVLVSPEHRSVAGWGAAILAARTGRNS